MLNRYSIAEARNRFAALVRGVEKRMDAIEVTRRGKTVAVILSLTRIAACAAKLYSKIFPQGKRENHRHLNSKDSPVFT